MLIRQIVFVLMISSMMLAQSSVSPPANGNAGTSAMAGPQAQSAPTNDRRSQILDDLNKLDSLNLNMSSEIEFLRDQNLQILLRTNSRMWTILIRDIRRQLEEEDQRRTAPPPQSEAPPAKQNPR